MARPWKLDDEHDLDAECYLQLLMGIFVHTAEIAGKPTAEEALEGLKAGSWHAGVVDTIAAVSVECAGLSPPTPCKGDLMSPLNSNRIGLLAD